MFTLVMSVFAYSQASSKISDPQNNPISITSPPFLIGADPLPNGTWRKYVFADIRISSSQVGGLNTAIKTRGDMMYEPILGFVPVNRNTKLSINGISYDLAGDRVWHVTYSSLMNKPTTLAGFGITDAYPLTGNPLGFLTSVPAQTWTSITGKPAFSLVSTSGDYNDLTNKPTLPADQVNSDWNSSVGITQILNKPILSSVATSGSYLDLNNKPIIPASQINSDWNSNTGLSQILNKPNIYSFTGLSNQYTKGDGTYASFPTNISTFTNDSGYTTTTALNAGLLTKENVISFGSTNQYWRGDKTWQTLNTSVVPEITNLYYTDTRARLSNSAGTGINYNSTTGVITNSSPDQVVSITGVNGLIVSGTYPNFTVSAPAIKRQETYSGNTNSSGVYTITYTTAYSATPNVQFQVNGGTNKTTILLTSSTATGCSFLVQARADILGLLPTYSNVNNAQVDVLVTEK